MLMLVSLLNDGLNQITFLFLLLPRLFVATYLDESVVPTTANSPGGDVLSLRVGLHWVYLLQSTLKSAISEGFILKIFFT